MSDVDMSRLRWRCRRGMRELDMLLLNFVERRYALADADEQASFRRLLTMPDPEILALLTGKAAPHDELQAHVVAQLLSTHQSG